MTVLIQVLIKLSQQKKANYPYFMSNNMMKTILCTLNH